MSSLTHMQYFNDVHLMWSSVEGKTGSHYHYPTHSKYVLMREKV